MSKQVSEYWYGKINIEQDFPLSFTLTGMKIPSFFVVVFGGVLFLSCILFLSCFFFFKGAFFSSD